MIALHILSAILILLFFISMDFYILWGFFLSICYSVFFFVYLPRDNRCKLAAGLLCCHYF